MAEVELDIPARLEYLNLARRVVVAAASVEPTFADGRIEDLRLAVSEATTNAVEAALSSEPGGAAARASTERIKVRCDLAEDRVVVEVIDEATGFDPEDVVAVPDAEDPGRLERERGLGLPLMEHYADETEIRSSRGGTAVRLVLYPSARSARRARPSDEGADSGLEVSRGSAGPGSSPARPGG